VINNQPYFSEEITSYLNPTDLSKKPETLDLLTKSELKIVRLISESHTSQEIADELSISVRTVDKHRSNIVHKLKLEKKPTSLSYWAIINKVYL
jgi:DNA-binding NarL/FixJ family response regulator